MVLDLLLMPTMLAAPSALPVLFNGFGPSLIRSIVGAPRYVLARHGGRTMFDPAHVAEAMIYRVFGTIPTLADVVRAAPTMPAFTARAS